MNLMERLGKGPEAKLLIVHADDLGLCDSVNEAAIEALASGLVTSGSMMVPCPAFAAIADHARRHPAADLGLHLTLTCEWPRSRWRPVRPVNEVSSLVDGDGCLHSTVGRVARTSDPREVAAEIGAQIEQAIEAGARPTHLDSHMFALYGSPALFEVFLRTSREYGLPIPISRDWFKSFPFLPSLLGPKDIVLEQLIIIDSKVPADRWSQFYSRVIAGLRPGVSEILIHPGYDDPDLRAATNGAAEWGAAWRQRDFDFFTNDAFRSLLDKSGVGLTNWRELTAANL